MGAERRDGNYGRMGGNDAVLLRRKRVQWQEAIADEQMRLYKEAGEPSTAFYPPQEQELPVVHAGIVFQSREVKSKGRKGDLAKRRGGIINTVLEQPQNYPITKQNMGIVERHFGRLYKFAITLRNKGRLHPRIAEILDL